MLILKAKQKTVSAYLTKSSSVAGFCCQSLIAGFREMDLVDNLIEIHV